MLPVFLVIASKGSVSLLNLFLIWFVGQTLGIESAANFGLIVVSSTIISNMLVFGFDIEILKRTLRCMKTTGKKAASISMVSDHVMIMHFSVILLVSFLLFGCVIFIPMTGFDSLKLFLYILVCGGLHSINRLLSSFLRAKTAAYLFVLFVDLGHLLLFLVIYTLTATVSDLAIGDALVISFGLSAAVVSVFVLYTEPLLNPVEGTSVVDTFSDPILPPLERMSLSIASCLGVATNWIGFYMFFYFGFESLSVVYMSAVRLVQPINVFQYAANIIYARLFADVSTGSIQTKRTLKKYSIMVTPIFSVLLVLIYMNMDFLADVAKIDSKYSLVIFVLAIGVCLSGAIGPVNTVLKYGSGQVLFLRILTVSVVLELVLDLYLFFADIYQGVDLMICVALVFSVVYILRNFAALILVNRND